MTSGDQLSVREIQPGDASLLTDASPSWGSIVRPLLAAREATTGTTLIGFAGALPVGLVELVWTDPVELRNLHVLPPYRGRGYGTQLLLAAERTVSRARVLRLAVGLDNLEARRLYERLGYRATGEQQTVTYTYVDSAGVERRATETSEFLIKLL
ncbi:GNAT family N-acetyltransferase [Microbacterium timonense]|uniref:GNAT family N-acetyltransferase n=1 Tax=Microbacterium timonense TaxID=2086576 RepID=UPI00190E925A|nr:GNAT family N-acetyltransferase [Microbacterium timonense]